MPQRAPLGLWQLQLAAAQIETFARRSCGGEHVRVQAIDDEAPLLLGLDDVLALQDLQMVRDIGDVYFELGSDLTDVLWPAAEELHNPQTIFVGQRLQPL